MAYTRKQKAWTIGAAAAVLIVAISALALSQRAPAGPNITVYESPT